jgi:hypothetical protein
VRWVDTVDRPFGNFSHVWGYREKFPTPPSTLSTLAFALVISIPEPHP